MFEQLKKYKFITNRYFIAFVVFLLWVVFIDDNSLLYLRGLNKDIDKLEQKKAFYQKEIKHLKQDLKDLNDDDKLQKYAREELLMKKEGEDIYIIETDKKNK
jgi:cell division protein FtsB